VRLVKPRTVEPGHIPGAVSIPAVQAGFGTRLAWLAQRDQPIVLVGRDDEDARGAVKLALSVGLRKIGGYLAGGMTSWRHEKRPVACIERLELERLMERREADELQLLDVRERTEWEAGHVPDSLFTPWHDIDKLPDGLDPERPVAVMCASGQRAGVAASLMQPRRRARHSRHRRRRAQARAPRRRTRTRRAPRARRLERHAQGTSVTRPESSSQSQTLTVMSAVAPDLRPELAGASAAIADETSDHARQFAARLSALTAAPSRPRLAAISASAIGRGRLGAIGTIPATPTLTAAEWVRIRISVAVRNDRRREASLGEITLPRRRHRRTPRYWCR
jgi:rhodanese-related sulfurtransferase